MRVDHEGSQSVIVVLADLVLNHCEQVESGEDGSGQVNVVIEVEGHVIGSFERVCGCDHTASGLETGVDTCFRNGDCLLFHGLVDGGSVLIVHLVKLIDQADSFVSQNQSTCLKRPLLSDRISVHSSSQTHCTSSLSGSIDDSWEYLLYVLEELRLGSTWVSEQEAVDISPDLVLATNILGHSSKHSQRDGFLDELVSVDGWRD